MFPAPKKKSENSDFLSPAPFLTQNPSDFSYWIVVLKVSLVPFLFAFPIYPPYRGTPAFLKHTEEEEEEEIEYRVSFLSLSISVSFSFLFFSKKPMDSPNSSLLLKTSNWISVKLEMCPPPSKMCLSLTFLPLFSRLFAPFSRQFYG